MRFLRFFRRKDAVITQPKTPASRRRKVITWLVVLLVVGVVAWVVVSGILAMRQITAKNSGEGASFLKFAGDIPADQLSGEGDGRINFLLMGIGGSNHPGGMLADSIEIFSLDPVNNSAAFLSIPRDLYVPIDGYGRDKINTAYAKGWTSCQNTGCPTNSDPGGDLMKATVSQVIGQPIHYYIRLDFQGFTKMIDQLGGVQVYVDKALNDPRYPDAQMKGYDPLYIAAGQQNFDGATALKYARSRESTSDFDRARRQQQIILAVKQKATSLNFLTNPKKIADIIGTLGSHIRTDLQTDDWLPVANLVKKLDSSKIAAQVLDTGTDSPLKSQSDSSAGYIIVPKLGINDFTEVQEWVAMVMPEPYLLKEGAKVELVTPSSKADLGPKLSKYLRALGYNIISEKTTDTPPSKTSLTVYDSTPYTTALLKKRFSPTISQGKSGENSSGAQLVLTIGSSYQLPHAYVGLRQPKASITIGSPAQSQSTTKN